MVVTFQRPYLYYHDRIRHLKPISTALLLRLPIPSWIVLLVLSSQSLLTNNAAAIVLNKVDQDSLHEKTMSTCDVKHKELEPLDAQPNNTRDTHKKNPVAIIS